MLSGIISNFVDVIQFDFLLLSVCIVSYPNFFFLNWRQLLLTSHILV